MRMKMWARVTAVALCAGSFSLPTSAESLPSGVAGSWRITRVLPTKNVGCWSAEQARSLVGTPLVYSNNVMRWRDGDISLMGVVTRQLTAAQFQKENAGSGGVVDFAQLGIRGTRVLEVDLQHEDADITGASTEVPGDSVLVVSPNRIVVSACGVFMEAVRSTGAAATIASRR